MPRIESFHAAAGPAANTRPVGKPDISWGIPGQGGLLTELAETVPDLTWPESVRTYARMRRDAKITSILRAFTLPIIRATWSVDPAGVKNAEAVDLIAGDLGLPVLGQKGPPPESAIKGFSWSNHVRLALLSYVYGHWPTEKWFEIRNGRTHLAGWAERPPWTLAILDIGDDGQMRQVEQNTQTQPIPARNLVWFCNEREGSNYAGASMLRPCYTPWLLKHEVLRVHATAHRRWGVGVPVVHAPAGATPAQIEQARQLATGMRAGDQAGAGLPAGFDFTLAGMTGSTPDAVAFLRYLDEAMSSSALTAVLELGQTAHGSRALGETFFDIFILALQAAADMIGDTATYGDPAMPGICRALVDYNWGEDEPCPRIVASDVGDKHEITAAALQQLLASGAIHADPDLEAFLRDAWHLPAYKPPPPGAVPPGPPAPTAPGGAPGGGPRRPAQPPAPQAPPATQALTAAAAAAPQRRDLSAAEQAAGHDPAAMRRELDVARDRVLAAWAPVLRQQRADLADQVAAAVDDGHLAGLASLAAPTGDAAEVLYRAMAAQAARSAGRAVGEAAAQGVTIDPAQVKVDHARLRQLAEARATLAAQHVAQAASKRALQVVTASAGTEAAHQVTATLTGLSVAPLADDLGAALHAAAAEGRFAVYDAGPEAVYEATEWASDPNCCDRCKAIDGHRFASLADARAAYAAGAYIHCQGGLRCRGTAVAVWPPAPGIERPMVPPERAEPGEAPTAPEEVSRAPREPGRPAETTVPAPATLEPGDHLAGRAITRTEPGTAPGSARVELAGGGTVLLAPAGASGGPGGWSVTGTLPGARTPVTLSWAGGMAGWPGGALAWAVDAMAAGQVRLDDGAALLAWLREQGFTRDTIASGPPPFPVDVLADFNPLDHPRDPRGRFTHRGGLKTFDRPAGMKAIRVWRDELRPGDYLNDYQIEKVERGNQHGSVRLHLTGGGRILLGRGDNGPGNAGYTVHRGAVETDTLRTETPGVRIDVVDEASAEVQKHLAQFGDVPVEVRQMLADAGTEFYFGARPAPGLDDLAWLRGQHPRGYAPGRTWDDAAALYTPRGGKGGGGTVAIGGGTARYSSVNVSAHEAGHALDHALGVGGDASTTASFARLHKRAEKQFGKWMTPYFTEAGNPGGGASEFFAETFAAWTAARRLGTDKAAAGRMITRSVNASTMSWKSREELARYQAQEKALGVALASWYDKAFTEVKRRNRAKGVGR